MTRIARLFEDLKRRRRCGMIAYITAGDPSPEATPRSSKLWSAAAQA